MADARVVKCPECGGAVAEEARRCGYCGSPVATVRCFHCFHMNVPDSVHCSGCGHVLGLEPAGATDFIACPGCGLDFEVFASEPGKLRDCGKCGGQFVEHALLKSLLDRRELYGTAAPRPLRKWNPLHDTVRYLPCPVCRTLMNRKNFGGSSGVVIDVCHPHGVWFDAGELPRILSFVEGGGLALARRRELEELERKKRNLQGAAIPPALTTEERRQADSPTVAEYVVALIEVVAGLITR